MIAYVLFVTTYVYGFGLFVLQIWALFYPQFLIPR